MSQPIARWFAEIGADTKGLKKGLDETKSGGQTFASTFKNITGISMGFAGAAAAAGVALHAMSQYAMESINSASDMNETISKSSVVFGESSQAILEMGEQAAISLGMSKQEAIAAAGTFGNLFTSMGLSRDASAEMSMNLVKLASDLASFNNISIDEALQKLRSGIVGESEPLKSLGILINETTIKTEAMTLGLIHEDEKLNAVAKTQAIYSLMLKQTKNAQDDFARTSDGLANQQRILDAQLKDLSASIGEMLLPAFLGLVTETNKIVKAFNEFVTAGEKAKRMFQDEEKAARETSTTYGEYTDRMVDLEVKTRHMSDATAEQEKRIWRLKEQYGVLTKEEIRNMLVTGQITDEIADLLVYIGAYSTDLDILAQRRGWATEQDQQATFVYEENLKAVQNLNTEYAEMIGGLDDIAPAMAGVATTTTTASEAFKKLREAEDDLVRQSLKPFTEEMLQAKVMAMLTGQALLDYARSTGKLDEKTYTTLTGLQKINEAFDKNKDGLIDAKEATKEFYNAIKTVDIVVRPGIDLEIQMDEAEVRELKGLMGMPAHKTITVETNIITNRIDRRYGGEQTDQDFASGGSFMIPAGYPNDSFYMGGGHWASSGEKVTVTPIGKDEPLNTTITQNFYVNDKVDIELVAARVAREIQRRQ